MAMAEGDLIQDLSVFAVSVDGERLVVSLYGGPSNACGTVTYTIGPSRERRAALAQAAGLAPDFEPEDCSSAFASPFTSSTRSSMRSQAPSISCCIRGFSSS